MNGSVQLLAGVFSHLLTSNMVDEMNMAIE